MPVLLTVLKLADVCVLKLAVRENPVPVLLAALPLADVCVLKLAKALLQSTRPGVGRKRKVHINPRMNIRQGELLQAVAGRTDTALHEENPKFCVPW